MSADDEPVCTNDCPLAGRSNSELIRMEATLARLVDMSYALLDLAAAAQTPREISSHPLSFLSEVLLRDAKELQEFCCGEPAEAGS